MCDSWIALRESAIRPRNDGKVERFYFWRKPKVAKTFIKIRTLCGFIFFRFKRFVDFGESKCAYKIITSLCRVIPNCAFTASLARFVSAIASSKLPPPKFIKKFA